jgi:hypothetical protein
MGLWVLILVMELSDPRTSRPTTAAISHEFTSEAACQNAENFIRQDLEKRGMGSPTKVAGGCVRKY